MSALGRAERWGHEEVVMVRDRAAGLLAFIALHDTTLGPAIGGTRMRTYPSLDDALLDALRLARAMTSKCAMADMPFGGGKAVIVGDPRRDKTESLLRAYAGAVHRLGGRFHTGSDMGLRGEDVAVMARVTPFASHTRPGAGVDSAFLAALGVFASIEEAARVLDRPLRSLHVAVQGLGEVGGRLARLLAEAGARLTVADAEAARAARAARELEAEVCAPEAIYDVEADVFSPNAGGGVLVEPTLPRLRVRAVVGAANDQLGDEGDGDTLHARGILYAPDYVVNAGGLISVLHETGALDEAGVVARVRGIARTLSAVWTRARREEAPPHRVADAMVEERLAAARARTPS
ncbi:MAG TPA: Glu/Leu/Phe/Val dehydrogenase dimerization domain-containing protein [Vicinamibacteria bacterium]|nr:Glu/Leu/Phe/Val dehydrogenase dimerization domain-containing protein [Vicinamibacteria bacterium]